MGHLFLGHNRKIWEYKNVYGEMRWSIHIECRKINFIKNYY